MARPLFRRRSVTLLAAVALIAAACSDDATSSPPPPPDDGNDGVVVAPAAPIDAFLGAPVAATVSQVVADYAGLGAELLAAAAVHPDPAAFWATLDDDVLYAFRGPETAERSAAIDAALAFKAIAVADPTRTEPAGTRPAVRVYFVNGVNNTLDFARGTTAQLAHALGSDIVHFYNPTAFDGRRYQSDWCARSVAALLAERRHNALISSIEADERDAAAIAAAEDAGTLRWLASAVGRSIVGVGRDAVDALSGAALTAAEYATAVSCRGIDLGGDLLDHLGDWARNTREVARHWWAGGDGAEHANDDLVALIREDIANGTRVVLIGHSHGTLLSRYAYQAVDEWYADAARACVDAGPAPIAALYVSPAFVARHDDRQAWVMVHGDFLQILLEGELGIYSATAWPRGSQVQQGMVGRHDMRGYLEEGTETLDQIRRQFARLVDSVTSLPLDPDCLGDAAAEPEWVLAEVIPGPDPGTSRDTWLLHTLEPGRLVLDQVNDPEDPQFRATNEATYEAPPPTLRPGEVYEIPITVRSSVQRGEVQRFAGIDMIVLVDGRWLTSGVGSRAECRYVWGEGLTCSSPDENTGFLAFTAPPARGYEPGDTFDVAVAVLDCGNCGVVFRYRLAGGG